MSTKPPGQAQRRWAPRSDANSEADLARYDLASLRERETGTSAAPIELVRRLRERFPACTLRIYDGSTEAGIAALGDTDALRKPGSVGVAPPGGELRRGDDGEVLARSPSGARTSAS